MPLTLRPDAFRAWTQLCVAALSEARAEIDALNVFPVPDSDTGTNAYLTFVAGADAVEALGGDVELTIAGQGVHRRTAARSQGQLRRDHVPARARLLRQPRHRVPS